MSHLNKRVVWSPRIAMIFAIALLVTGCLGGGSSASDGGGSQGNSGYTVSGVVVDEDGNGIAGVTLTFSGGTTLADQTKMDGTWSVVGLKGKVTIKIAHIRYTFQPETYEVTGPEKNIRFVGTKWAARLLRGGEVVRKYDTIQAAIDDAQAGDVVEVFPGTYYENLDIQEPMTLRSTDPDNQPVIAPVDERAPTIDSGAYEVIIQGVTIIP